MTHDEIRKCLATVADAVEDVAGAVGTDLIRDNEGFIVDNSDLGIAVRELERVSMVVSRLSFRIALDDEG